MKTQPESNPPGRGSHGSENVDWVTVWFPGLNVQFINYQIEDDDNDYLRSGKAESNDSAVGRVEIIGRVLEDTSR